MKSKEWERAVTKLKEAREKALLQQEKESMVVSAGILIADHIIDSYCADVLIPRNDSEEIEINEEKYNVRGVDADMLLNLLRDAGYNVAFTEGGIERKDEIRVLLQ